MHARLTVWGRTHPIAARLTPGGLARRAGDAEVEPFQQPPTEFFWVLLHRVPPIARAGRPTTLWRYRVGEHVDPTALDPATFTRFVGTYSSSQVSKPEHVQRLKLPVHGRAWFAESSADLAGRSAWVRGDVVEDGQP